MLFPEELCNRSPGFSALAIWEETPSPLSFSCPTDGLHQLTRQHYVVISLRSSVVLFLPAHGGPALPGGPFRLGVSYQSRVETPLPEVHPPRYPGMDILGPTDAQRLRENDVRKNMVSLGVPTLVKYPLPLRSQY